MEIRVYDSLCFSELVDFASHMNSSDLNYIGYFGDNKLEITNTLNFFNTPLNNGGCKLAYENGHLVGFLGVEFDVAVRRAWLYGPLISSDDKWQEKADQLIGAVNEFIPGNVDEYEIYCSKDNINCQVFAQRHDFNLFTQSYSLALLREDSPIISDVCINQFDDFYFAQLSDLHSQLFPDTYFSAQKLVTQQNKDDVELLIEIENNQLLGYIFFSSDRRTGEGFVDYLGVKPDSRNHGIGKRLILAMIKQIFRSPEITRISCTISSSNDAIIRICTSIGFQNCRTMHVYRKKIQCGEKKA